MGAFLFLHRLFHGWLLFNSAFFAGCFAVAIGKRGTMYQSVKAPPEPNVIQRIFEPSKSVQMELAAAKWQGPVETAKAPSPSTIAIKGTVSTTEHLLWCAGVVCLLGAGACFYFGMYIPGAKLAAAGLLLPIFATWFAFNYLWIMAIALIGSAIGFLWAERNSSLEKSIANAAYFEIQDAYKKLCAAVAAGASAVEKKLWN